jgi:hypothetical protein
MDTEWFSSRHGSRFRQFDDRVCRVDASTISDGTRAECDRTMTRADRHLDGRGVYGFGRDKPGG